MTVHPFIDPAAAGSPEAAPDDPGASTPRTGRAEPITLIGFPWVMLRRPTDRLAA